MIHGAYNVKYRISICADVFRVFLQQIFDKLNSISDHSFRFRYNHKLIIHWNMQ